VSRRVDSFHFAGDDERVLHRHQSVDLALPVALSSFASPLLDQYGGFPTPITFVSKWRLPEFSVRSRGNTAVSLLHREETVKLAAAMLISLGSYVWSEGETLIPSVSGTDAMPYRVRSTLMKIASGEPDRSLQGCIDFQDTTLAKGEDLEWRSVLASSELFMSLAYELARGFLLVPVVPLDRGSQPLLKFSYNSYVVPAEHDTWSIQIGHALRWVRTRSRDAIDPSWWGRSSARRARGEKARSGAADSAELTIATSCQDAPSQLKHGARSVTCATVAVKGPGGRQNIRVRPSGIVVLRDLPPGTYDVRIKPRSGYSVEPKAFSVGAKAGGISRVHLRTRRRTFSHTQTLAAPAVAAPPWRPKRILRGIGWNSKPLVIRVRLGGGGSYHCEFEAPAGLHVTRARLLSNLEGNEPSRPAGQEEHRNRARARYVDTVLESTQRAHLYAPIREGGPSTGYVFLNLRPRVETIVRPATLTALFTVAILSILALLWMDPPSGFDPANPPLGLLALILGGPSALAAYFAQAVPSRVTNAMLYGVRLLSLLPVAVAVLAAGAILAWGEGAGVPLMVVAGLAALASVVLLITYWFAEHPREQRASRSRQGPEFEDTHVEYFGSGAPIPRTEADPDLPREERAEAIRDRMLERSGGMMASTRAKLLWQRWLFFWETEVPPALYFDSAEPPAVYLGPTSVEELEGLRSALDGLLSTDSQGDRSSDSG
jgi:hypothetical protein